MTAIWIIGAAVFLSQGILGLLMPDRMMATQHRVGRLIGLRQPVVIDARAPSETILSAVSLAVGVLFLIQLVTE
jgi:hypothetical protein